MSLLSKTSPWLLASAFVACSGASAADAPAGRAPAIASLAIPGDPRFVAIARDVLLVQTELSPDFASQSGLVDDAIRVPSFAPEHVAALTQRLRDDMARLCALPWRGWGVDEQIDVRWIYANAERIDRELNVERLYRRRPGAWLEPLANNYISILTYAPTRGDALASITARVPARVAEMRALSTPREVDAEVGRGVVDGIVSMLRANPAAKGDTVPADARLEQRRGALRRRRRRELRLASAAREPAALAACGAARARRGAPCTSRQ